MASKKRKAPSTPSQVRFDRSRFTSQEAWERYTGIMVPRKLLPERNVVVYYTEFDEFKEELERRHWDEELTDFTNSSINIAIVKEFYANLYDPEDKSPKQVRVNGHLVKFDEDTPNTFLKTPELATKLCIPGRGFELNADGQSLKILRKNMTTLAQTWSVLSFSNLIPTSHTSDVTLDRAKLIYAIIMKMDMNVGYHISHQISLTAQHDTSKLGFPALIIALCKARGSLSPAINLAYIKKKCWNLDDPTVTFKGPRKARGKRSEVPTTSAPLETTNPSSSIAPTPLISTPSQTPIPLLAPSPFQLPALLSAGPSDFLFTPQMLYSMLQSLRRGWPGQDPSLLLLKGEPKPEEPATAVEGEDELTPCEPFYFDAVPIPDDSMPSAPASELEQPIPQDSPAAQVLDLNEHAQEQPMEQDI
ncbi:hypothetical protein HKD37_01G001539 [Glycine soja]